MTSIDSVRVLLQSLPAASPAVGSNNNAQQNELTPAKLGTATPLRARNSQQQQQQQQQLQYQQQAQQQLFFGTPEKLSGNASASANDKQLRAPEEFWRDLHQFHERRG